MIHSYCLPSSKDAGGGGFDSPLAQGFSECGPDPLVYHEITFVEPHKYYLRNEIEKERGTS